MSEEEKVEKKDEKKQFLFSEEEYKKFENRRLEFSNALIGTFDSKGDYKITPEILKEFVAMPKVIREVRENRYYAISSSKLGATFNVKFSVVVGEVDDEKKYATLCLLEDVVNLDTGTYSLKSTPIATYHNEATGDFAEKMKKVFNLKQVDELVGDGLFDPTKYPNFFAAKSKKIKLKGQFDAFGDEIEENYVKEMLKELKKMGPYGEWVLKNFVFQQKMMGGKFPQKGTKGYFKVYAKLLDQAILNAKGFPMTPEQIATINRIQQKRMENVRMATTEVVLAPKPKAKPAAKTAGGEEAKPAAKKKSDKKEAKKDDKKKPKKDDKKKPKYVFPKAPLPKTQPKNEMPPPPKPNDDLLLKLKGGSDSALKGLDVKYNSEQNQDILKKQNGVEEKVEHISTSKTFDRSSSLER